MVNDPDLTLNILHMTGSTTNKPKKNKSHEDPSMIYLFACPIKNQLIVGGKYTRSMDPVGMDR